MQDPPDIDVRLSLDVEKEVRKPVHNPRAQAGEVQFKGIAGRAASRVFAYVAKGFFQCVDEPQSDSRRRLAQVVFDGLVDIETGSLAENDWR